MQEIKKRNIDFLAEHYPALLKELNTTDVSGNFTFVESPKPNIYFHRRPLHSPLNPEQEAENLLKDLNVRPGLIFVFLGLGLGYQVKRLKELYGRELENVTIIVIERSSEVFSLLANQKDISFLKNTHLFIGEKSSLLKEFFATLNPLAFKGYRIIRLRGALSPFQQYYSEVEHRFKETMSGKLSDVLTRFAFESLWMKNIIENLPSFVGRQPISVLNGILHQKPVLVIGAGPSLSTQLDTIRKIGKKLHLIAVDTALRPLLLSGIEPDFVVTLDAQFFNIHDFSFLFTGHAPRREINLIADVVVYPKIVKQWKGALFFSETAIPYVHENRICRESHPLMTRFRDYFPLMDSLECGGSVSTTALEFALHLGAHPVLVAGLDLAYTSYKTHVNSSTHYTFFCNRSHRLKPLSSMITKALHNRRLDSLEGIHGNRVLSDFVFEGYLNWIQQKRSYRNRVINVTEDGARIPGLKHICLERLLKNMRLEGKESPLRPATGNRLSRTVSLEFLSDLKEDSIRARKELESGSAIEADVKTFLQTFPFLRNNVLEATALYPDRKKAYAVLSLFLKLIEKKIALSIEKIV